MAADGSIVIETRVDNSQAQKDLNKLNKEIAKQEQKLNEAEQAQEPLRRRAEELRASIKQAADEAERYKQAWISGAAGADRDEMEARETVSQLSAEYDNIIQKIQKYDNTILSAQSKLDAARASAGSMAQQVSYTYDNTSQLKKASEKVQSIVQRIANSLKQSGENTDKMKKSMDRATKSASKFSSRIKEVVRSALVFTLITQALAQFREWLGRVIQANDETAKAVAQLQGALLTLAQPLLNIIIPAFTALVNVLTRVVTAIASVLATLFGGTIDQSKDAAKALQGEIDALENTGSAAKSAGKSLASFDEINKLSSPASQTGGAASAISPSFDFDTKNVETDMDKILQMIKLIGAALLGWKFSDSFLGGVKSAIGFFMALDGAIELAKAIWDAWQNGVDEENLLSILGRATELILGLYIALGPTAAAIGAIVAGITMLVTAFKDADANGWNFYNTALAIAGLLSAGLGIGILTGSWIPLLIAGIASALLAIVNTFGDGEKLIEDLKLAFSGLLDFIQGVFTGDLELALSGIGKIFDGLRGIVDNIFSSIENMINSFFDWLDQKTGGQFTLTINYIRKILLSLISWAKTSLQSFIDAFQGILEGLITFISGVFSGNWDQAWEGLVNIGKGAVNLLISMIESFVNFWINGLNTLIRALNSISFTAPDWVPVIGGQTYGVNIPLVPNLQIPRLATGAVIPPNREFLAVLGDQKQGTNVEAPLSAIEQAVANVMSRMGYGAEQTVILQVDKDQLGKVVYKLNKAESRRIGVNLAGV